MKLMRRICTAGIVFLVFCTVLEANPITFSASGANPASILGTVDAFRATLGSLNPNVAGSFGTGRREINWDGVPDVFSSPNASRQIFSMSTHREVSCFRPPVQVSR